MGKKRSSGEGQLRQRPNGLWELTIMIGYQDDGRRKLKSFYGKTQKEAKDKAYTYRREQELGLSNEGEMTFGEWADTWYAGYRDAVSPTTYEGYRYTLAILKSTFGRKKLREIKPMHVEKFLRDMRSEGKSDSYLTKCRGMLFQILHKAEANDFILKNPVRFADKMKRSHSAKKEKDSFTSTEIKQLLCDLPHDRVGHSIRVMIGTGLRPQEMVGLQPEHIAPDGSQIYVRQAVKMLKGKAYIGDTKSYESVRDIPVPELFRCSAIYLREQAKEFVWTGKNSAQPFNLRNFRDKFAQAIGSVENVRLLTPHCCRHTYITQMQALGVDMETIKELAGHADTEMTGHYVHIQREAMENAAKKMSDAFGDKDDAKK